jgi:diketogulonate reductase-like aldo/keto reductase
MTLSLRSTLTLHNGVEIPRLGLGVYQSPPGAVTQRAVREALALGYCHIDTAKAYRNEEDVGRALADSGLQREEVFVTTKLWHADHGYDEAIRACRDSLGRLGLAVVDLYLIHWPGFGPRRESWRALVTLYEEGKCRAVGVSNYTVRHLEELLATSPLVPMVNQVELSPFLSQRDLIDICRRHKIAVEAYSPLTQGQKLDDERLLRVARKHRKTAAQVLIRWALEHDLIVLPKTVRRERLQENADVFDFALDGQDMAILDGLDEGLRVAWDPTNVP